MSKIPLEATIAAMYRFLFTRILSILGTLWLPFLIMAVVWGAILYLAVPHAWWQGQFPEFAIFNDKHPDPAAVWAVLQPFAVGIPLLMITGLVLQSVMSVGLLRLSLGQTKSCYVYFSLGADVWRMILATILIFVFLYAYVALAIIAGIALSEGGKAFIPEAARILSVVVYSIFAVCFGIYAMVRLFFFLPAVVVAEHRLGLGHAWALGKGNFWRIVLICLMIVIPVAIVGGTIWQMTVMPIIGSEIMRFPEHPTHADAMNLLRAMLPLIPVFVGVNILERVAMMGLIAGAQGSAYNALVPREQEKTDA